MKKGILYIVAVWVVFFLPNTLSAQDIDALKEEIRQAEAVIKKNGELLAGNQNKQKDRVLQLSLLRSTIQSRKKIISSLDQQIVLIKRNIANNNSGIRKLDKTLEQSREEYARTVRDAYIRSKQNNVFAFIFSSGDFHNMVRRIFYLKRFASVRQVKADELRSTAEGLKKEVSKLKAQQQELDDALRDKSNELQKLAAEEKQQQKLIDTLKNEEGRLYAEIKKQQDVIAGLNRKVEQIIAEEARKNEGKKRSKTEEEEIVRLSGNFAQNKGKLPFPVAGVITDRFGIHAHPLQPNLTVNNKGINVMVKTDSRVYSVFEGEVVKVFFYQGLGNSVMIRHGDYITVYTNLNEVSVRVGQKVATREAIGRISCGESSATFHFELWNKTTPQNPELWLRKS